MVSPCARYSNPLLHFQGQPGRSSIARVERYACSLQARLFSLWEWGLLIFPCVRPTRGVRDRAFREHRRSSGSITFSVPRTGGRPGWPFHPLTDASQTTHPDVSCRSCSSVDGLVTIVHHHAYQGTLDELPSPVHEDSR